MSGAVACVAASGGGGVEGVTSVDDEAGEDAEYPGGPYGKEPGEVFPRMTFVDAAGAVVDLANDYEADHRVRVLFATTAWCSPCVPDAEYLHQQMDGAFAGSRAYGLLLEDVHGGAARAEDAAAFNLELTSFEFLADPGKAMEGVFSVAAAYPRVVVLSTQEMRIVYIGTGHDMDAVVDGIESVEGS